VQQEHSYIIITASLLRLAHQLGHYFPDRAARLSAIIDNPMNHRLRDKPMQSIGAKQEKIIFPHLKIGFLSRICG
jgi:hypothetical protein